MCDVNKVADDDTCAMEWWLVVACESKCDKCAMDDSKSTCSKCSTKYGLNKGNMCEGE